MEVLVIRSAREDVLHDCLGRLPSGTRVTLLGQPLPGGAVDECLEAPPGPLSWQRLPTPVRRRLRAGEWSEIVVLHNLGDDSYAAIIALALRAGPLTALRIVYADGVEQRYPAALALAAKRGVRSLAAGALLGVLMLVALPIAAMRALRS